MLIGRGGGSARSPSPPLAGSCKVSSPPIVIFFHPRSPPPNPAESSPLSRPCCYFASPIPLVAVPPRIPHRHTGAVTPPTRRSYPKDVYWYRLAEIGRSRGCERLVCGIRTQNRTETVGFGIRSSAIKLCVHIVTGRLSFSGLLCPVAQLERTYVRP